MYIYICVYVHCMNHFCEIEFAKVWSCGDLREMLLLPVSSAL